MHIAFVSDCAINGAETQIACVGAVTCTSTLSRIRKFSGQKWIEKNPSFPLPWFHCRHFSSLADIGRSPVLPDDGVVNRLAGGAVPDAAVSR